MFPHNKLSTFLLVTDFEWSESAKSYNWWWHLTLFYLMVMSRTRLAFKGSTYNKQSIWKRQLHTNSHNFIPTLQTSLKSLGKFDTRLNYRLWSISTALKFPHSLPFHSENQHCAEWKRNFFSGTFTAPEVIFQGHESLYKILFSINKTSNICSVPK